MNRNTLVAAVAAMMMTAALAEGRRNLITNFDHSDRLSIGLPIGWIKHIRDKLLSLIHI